MNPSPKTEQLRPHQFKKRDAHTRSTYPVRLRLPHDLADIWEKLSLETRSAVVQSVLERVLDAKELDKHL